MKICCISDLHGNLPTINPCDLLLIAGDICPTICHDITFQKSWLETNFNKWLESVPCKKIITIAGNHDFVFEKNKEFYKKLKCDYLEDNFTVYNGVKIYGTPYQPIFFDWAFNASDEDLLKIFSKIPDDTDILLSHGPPKFYGDFSSYGQTHCGSEILLNRIIDVKPKLVVCGHIHEGYGIHKLDSTDIVNASIVNSKYKPVNQPIVIELF